MTAKITNLLNLDHHTNITEAVGKICSDNTFCDCILYGSDGYSIMAHRAILSLCSPFLKTIIENHPLNEPQIFLPDVSKTEIVAILEFIYTGEATVPLEYIEPFFETCKVLQIAHLKEYEVKNEFATKTVEDDLNSLEVLDLPTLDIESQCAITENLIETMTSSIAVVPGTDEVEEAEWDADLDNENQNDEDYEDRSVDMNKLNVSKQKMIYTNEDIGFIRDHGPACVKRYECKKCGKRYSHRRTLLHHIHWICGQPATYACTQCPYRGKRKFQLRSHVEHVHLFNKRRSLLKPKLLHSMRRIT